MRRITITTYLCLLVCLLHRQTAHAVEQSEHELRKQHNQQQQVHWNQKYQQQHGSYKQRIQHQRRQPQQKKQSNTYQQQHYYNKNRQTYYNQHKKQPVYHYKKRYHYKYKKRKYKYIKWPRIRGRCKYSPWTVDGKNPVLAEAAKGNMVLLFMLKASDPFSFKQLDRMNDMAEHYSAIGRKITLMALNHRSRKIPASYRKRFPLVQFYQEPASEDLYTKLRANYRYNIIYDKCGRQQYHFAPPYSWLGYDITRLAIDNVRKFHTDYHLCGVCKPAPTTVAPTTSSGNNNNATVLATTRLPITKASQKPVDGPYTNIPVAKRTR